MGPLDETRHGGERVGLRPRQRFDAAKRPFGGLGRVIEAAQPLLTGAGNFRIPVPRRSTGLQPLMRPAFNDRAEVGR